MVPVSIEVLIMKVTLDLSEDRIKEIVNNYVGDCPQRDIDEVLIIDAVMDELQNMQLLRNYNSTNNIGLSTILYEVKYGKI